MTSPPAPVSYRWHLAALVLAALHHADHVLRGTHVGWPVTPGVNAFTYSLAIYPVVLLGFALRSTRYWLFAVLGGIAMLVAVHVVVETPADILEGYAHPAGGPLAFGVLVALLAVLAFLAWRYALLARRGR